MIANLTHRVEILAMNLAIEALNKTRRSSSLSQLFAKSYRIAQGKLNIFWLGALCATGIAGFLTGYLGFFALPR